MERQRQKDVSTTILKQQKYKTTETHKRPDTPKMIPGGIFLFEECRSTRAEQLTKRFCVSICTFVPVKLVTFVPFQASSLLLTRISPGPHKPVCVCVCLCVCVRERGEREREREEGREEGRKGARKGVREGGRWRERERERARERECVHVCWLCLCVFVC